MANFTWTPDFGASKTVKSNVIEAKFGDSYSQRQQVGINAISQEWNLTFSNRSQSEADAIDSFLTSMGGYLAFDFTPPSGTSIRVVCRSGSWSKQTVKYNFYTIQAKFEQVFEP